LIELFQQLTKPLSSNFFRHAQSSISSVKTGDGSLSLFCFYNLLQAFFDHSFTNTCQSTDLPNGYTSIVYLFYTSFSLVLILTFQDREPSSVLFNS
jgi:hypothetical protein